MDIIGLYCEFVIKPIEKERNRLLVKVYSKNIFDFLSRSLYKEYLEKFEKLLYEKYQYLGELINEEIEFNNSIKAKLKSIDQQSN